MSITIEGARHELLAAALRAIYSCSYAPEGPAAAAEAEYDDERLLNAARDLVRASGLLLQRPAEFVEADRTAPAVSDRGQRVSHDFLMAATKALGQARDAEFKAGNTLRAGEINGLVLGVFVAAIRVEDIDVEAAQQAVAAQ